MTRNATTANGRLAAYTQDAERYDERTAPFQCWRDLVVDVLPLACGDSVVDVGCGTGLCFGRLENVIGGTGRIIGVDDAPEMLAIASRRVEQNGWSNVELVTAPARRAQLPESADAAIFCAVHDVLQDPAALRNVLGQLRPGAWVSAVGGRWAHPCLMALNLAIRSLHAPYIRDFGGFDRPWELLEVLLDDARVTEIACGSGYCLLGHTSPASQGG